MALHQENCQMSFMQERDESLENLEDYYEAD